MGLVGNLKDLGLGEILQIVSLSRKTGVLSLRSGDREGSIVFRLGQVVRAASSSYHQSLGEVLIQNGVINLAVLHKSLALQQEQGFKECLGTILVKSFGVTLDVIEEVVREQIEKIVFSLFAWTEGNFNFEVLSDIETADSVRLDPYQFMLDKGLNPQFLAMEGANIVGEMRCTTPDGITDADSTENAADFSFDLSDETNSRTFATTQPVVIVDDDLATLRAISDGLTGKGFVVHALNRSEDALIKVDSIYRDGQYPIVLIDLAMPNMDGSGEFGGMELLELLHNNFKNARLVVMNDCRHPDSEKRVSEMGCHFILKPGGVDTVTPTVMQNFTSRLLHDIQRLQ